MKPILTLLVASVAGICHSSAEEMTRAFPLRLAPAAPAERGDVEAIDRVWNSPLQLRLGPGEGKDVANPRDSQSAVQEFLERAKVSFDPADTTKYFYNDRTRTLHVRAGAEDLAAIEKAVASAAQASPAEVKLEVKFVECIEEIMPKLKLAHPPAGPFESTRLAEMKAEAAAERGDQPKFSLRVLTAGEARDLIASLEKQEGVDMLSAPPQTTPSGRQARITVEEIETVTIPPFHTPTPKQKEALRFNAE